MSSTPLVACSFALPSATTTWPAVTIGLCQCTPPDGSVATCLPVVEYPHTQGCSVTGGYVYRGKKAPAAAGRYFYGDYCSGTIWSLKIAGGKATSIRREPFRLKGLSSFGEDSSGELYLMSVDSGDLFRLAG